MSRMSKKTPRTVIQRRANATYGTRIIYIPMESAMQIKDSVALVTGANRGIGRAFVEALLERGASSIYAAARDVASLDAVVRLDPKRIRALKRRRASMRSCCGSTTSSGSCSIGGCPLTRTQHTPAVTACSVAFGVGGRLMPHGPRARRFAITAPRTRSTSRTSSSGQRSSIPGNVA